MTQPQVKALLVGHSYIKRFQQLVENGSYQPRGPEGMNVQYIGVGGGRLTQPPDNKNLFSCLEQIEQIRPNVVYIHLGENDLQRPGVTAEGVYQAIIQMVECLVDRCHPHTIVISQLTRFPATPHLDQEVFWINRRLQAYCDVPDNQPPGTTILMWKHHIGIAGDARLKNYSLDHVHLNENGFRKYCRSVMSIVGGRCNEFLKEHGAKEGRVTKD